MSEKMDFAGGKYTVINDNGKLMALRYGEPWGRDLTGDNLVYWMLVDSLRLKEQRDAIQQVVDEQAEDEGLWFRAQTAAEAYLQQELRRLHAAVEGEK